MSIKSLTKFYKDNYKYHNIIDTFITQVVSSHINLKYYTFCSYVYSIETDVEHLEQLFKNYKLKYEEGIRRINIIKLFKHLGWKFWDQCEPQKYTNYIISMAYLDWQLYEGSEKNDQLEIVKLLHSYGVPINTGALTYSVQKPEFVTLLLELGADVHQINQEGFTTLHMCGLLDSKKEVVLELIKHGADINCKTQNNDTPLHFAYGSVNTLIFKQNYSKFYKEIVYLGWNEHPVIITVNNEDNIECTDYFEPGWLVPNIPISYETLAVLLEHNADPNIINSHGDKAINIYNNDFINEETNIQKIKNIRNQLKQNVIPLKIIKSANFKF